MTLPVFALTALLCLLPALGRLVRGAFAWAVYSEAQASRFGALGLHRARQQEDSRAIIYALFGFSAVAVYVGAVFSALAALVDAWP